MTKLMNVIAIVFFCTCTTFAQTETSVVDEQPAQKIHRFQKGDSLRALAQEFLGGEQFMTELLEYNQISNPLSVRPGYLLAIPGKERAEALAALGVAEKSMAVALEAQAPKYAATEYQFANSTLQGAYAARKKASYDKAKALARLTVLRAQHAKATADENAPVEQPATITAVSGKAEISHDGGKSWAKATKGSKVQVNEIIRTDGAARVEVTLADESVIQILESSRFVLQRFLYDRRDGRRDSQLQVIMGDILGKIKKRKVNDSKFKVRVGKTAYAAIRGTELRLNTGDEETSRVAVLTGEALMDVDGKSVVLPTNFGSHAKGTEPPAAKVKLLPPPTVSTPKVELLETAVQQPSFRWSRIVHRRFANFHMEVATDDEFNFVVQNHYPERNYLKPDVLAPGDYYWRVSTVDTNGLEGSPTPTRRLRIRKELGVRIRPLYRVVRKRSDRYVVNKSNFFRLETDEKSSVVKYEISFDDGSFAEYTGTFPLPKEGKHNIRVRGRAADNTTGEVVSLDFESDITPPSVGLEIVSRDSAPVGEPLVTARVIAKDNTEIEYAYAALDDGRFEEAAGPISVEDREGGVITFYASDLAGNRSKVRSVRIQGEWVRRGLFFKRATKDEGTSTSSKESPSIRATLSPLAQSAESGEDQFELIFEAVSPIDKGIKTIEYAVNNRKYQKYTTPLTIPLKKKLYITYRAEDEAGNKTRERTIRFTGDWVKKGKLIK